MGNFGNQGAFTAVLAIFLCACAESPLFMFPVRNRISPSFSVTSISYKGAEISANQLDIDGEREGRETKCEYCISKEISKANEATETDEGKTDKYL